jgi:hypothetical protein
MTENADSFTYFLLILIDENSSKNVLQRKKALRMAFTPPSSKPLKYMLLLSLSRYVLYNIVKTDKSLNNNKQADFKHKCFLHK